MKSAILAKAKVFEMTLPDFVDYCIGEGNDYGWYNVGDLLDLTKDQGI